MTGAQVNPREQDTDIEQERPTLRLALAMRGGVSLAVWIGGAVAELDVVRRATANQTKDGLGPTIPFLDTAAREDDVAAKRRRERLREDRRGVYRDLLDLADIDHIEIDVLAGASAGGLNAVLYGTALANGRRVDDMRDTWAELAEFPALLRQTAKRRRLLVPSLLRGDEYFYQALRKRLADLAVPVSEEYDWPNTLEPDQPTPAARYLTIALSATMLPKNDSRGVREERERGADSGRASFSFSLRPTTTEQSTLTDFPAGPRHDAAWRAYHVDRLALGGRATSSFPGGFEPARIYADQSRQAEVFHHQGEQTDDPMYRYRRGALEPMPNMVDVFSAARPPEQADAEQPFSVVDGGVFDNIAVGRALTAIAHAPSVVHTRRWLIYLDPDPAKAPVPKFRSLRPPAFTLPRIVLNLARMRAASATVRDDLEAIQHHNEHAQARRATTDAYNRVLLDQTRATAAAAGPGSPARTQALIALAQQLTRPDGRTMLVYDKVRAATDLPRLTRLLVRPQQTISGQIVRMKGFDPWSEESVGEVMLQLRPALHQWYYDPDKDLHLDLTAVMDAADFFIAWTRALERWRYEGDQQYVPNGWRHSPGERKRIKRVLYRVHFIASALRDLADHELLQTERMPLSERVRLGLDRVYRRQGSFRLSSKLHEFFNLTPDPQGFRTPVDSDATFYAAAAEYLAGSLSQPDQPGQPPEPAVVDVPANLYLWRRLTELFEALVQQSPQLLPLPPDQHDVDEADRPWRNSPFHLLTSHPELLAPDTSGPGRDEPPMARLGPIFAAAGGLPDSTQMVAFDTFTADQFSPLHHRMHRLRTAVKADWARQMLNGRMPDITRPWLDSRTKLAGNQLANFAGFLDRRWRNNDWMWGRADSAANTVGLLLRQVNERHLSATGKPRVIAAANRLAGQVGQPAKPTWTADEIRELGDRITEKLQDSIVEELLAPAFGDDARRRRFIRKAPQRRLEDLTTGQETPAVLAAHRRSGLMVHTGLLAFRTMLPSPSDIRTTIMRLAALAIRPVWVLALLALMPARAALLLGLVLAGSAASGFGGSGSAPVRIGVLAILACIGCLLLTLRADSTRRRQDLAEQAVKRHQPPRQLMESDQPIATRARTEAREDAQRLADEAIRVIDRLRSARYGVAFATIFLAVLLGAAAVLTWPRFGPWLAEGNWASFTGIVALELGAFALLWAASDHHLRARTGKRRPRQPVFIWILALAAIVAAITAGHVPSVVEAINRVGSFSLADGGEAWIAIVGAAILLIAMVTVSTFDWMRLTWLPAAWLIALLCYAGLLVIAIQFGRGFAIVVTAAISYGFSYAYLISVFCKSRYPRDDPSLPGQTPGQ